MVGDTAVDSFLMDNLDVLKENALKKANEYILDEDSAKMAVDYYLQKKAKQKR